MILSNEEKLSITNLETDENLKIEDESRGMYWFEVEKVRHTEYRVSKWAIMCQAVEYFPTADEVISFIER